ncbi:NIF3-like protein 1 [Stegastes partitus]|uniref:NIF3-like protein 1 n=1 Tax=Stegastes partitus TaxID=144197 RepID=A0A3B4ZIH0_9TELE|nr:PREDICTED: putative GTP cyclohydrolase 1 type 2 NIF3L1 [Stegastes partitus]XP_008300727.1 PREDICTED: putative GTP cyclohydrolase 1 type 2 NIF3L1 [Stegastes partitus]
MLAGGRNLPLTFLSLTNRGLWTRKNFKPLPALCSSASTLSSILPSPPSSTPSHSFLSTRQTSAPLHPPVCFSSTRCLSHSAHCTGLMELKQVLQVLEQLAPLSLAESWDNVGLLVEPSKPRPVKTILLTNDLTAAVMEEAEAASCDLIISYHPPLFRPIKRLVQKDWKQRLAVRAVEAGIAVFSPHTSWDSVKGGVNDWLVGGLGSGRVSVLSQALGGASHSHKLEFTVRSTEELNTVMEELKAVDGGTTLQHTASRPDSGGIPVSITCSDSALTPSVQTLLRHSTPSQSLSILKLEKPPLPGHGQGRLSVLDEPVTVATAIQKMKSHLGLSHLRLALGSGQTMESSVSTVAVCAGSGASVLSGVKADLYVTGEMSHHEVLDAAANGTSVILSDHSNSERGFLAVFRERLAVRLPDVVTVMVSKADRDPLEVV